MVDITVELVERTDNFEEWRQKVNQAMTGLEDVSLVVSDLQSLTDQFRYVEEESLGNGGSGALDVKINSGIIRNASSTTDIAEDTVTILGVDDTYVIYVTAVSSIITFSSLSTAPVKNIVPLYTVTVSGGAITEVKDVRTWATVAIDSSLILSDKEEEVFTGVATDTFLTTFDDTYLTNVSLYIDGVRQPIVGASPAYTVASVGGKIEVTTAEVIDADSEVLVVVNQDDHSGATGAINVISEVVQATVASQTQFTVTDPDLQPVNSSLAVYVQGVRQVDFNIISADTIELLEGVDSGTDVQIVKNESQGTEEIGLSILEGGEAGQIIYKVVDGEVKYEEWRDPEFDASAVTTGVFNPDRIPRATIPEALAGATDEAFITPLTLTATFIKEVFNRWAKRHVGSFSDFYFCGTSCPDTFGNYFAGVSYGGVIKNPEVATNWNDGHIFNTGFSGLNGIATVPVLSNWADSLVFAVGDNNKIAWSNSADGVTYSTFNILPDAQLPNNPAVESWHYTDVETIRVWEAASAPVGEYPIKVFVVGKRDGLEEYNVWSADARDIEAGTPTWTKWHVANLTDPIFIKTMLVTELNAGVADLGNESIGWASGGNFYWTGNSQDAVAPSGLNAMETQVASASVATSLSIVESLGGEATDKYNVIIGNADGTVVYNVDATPLRSRVSPIVFTSSTIIPDYTQGALNVISNSAIFDATPADVKRQVYIGGDEVSLSGFKGNASEDVGRTFDAENNYIGGELVRSMEYYWSTGGGEGATPVNEKLRAVSFVQNSSADLMKAFPTPYRDSNGSTFRMKFSSVPAFTSRYSPAPITEIIEMASNSLVTIAATSDPLNCIWVLDENEQGGDALALDHKILGAYHESDGTTDLNNHFFFVLTTDDLHYSVSTDGKTYSVAPRETVDFPDFAPDMTMAKGLSSDSKQIVIIVNKDDTAVSMDIGVGDTFTTIGGELQLRLNTAVGSYVVGETITGSSSGATADVKEIIKGGASPILSLENVVGTFTFADTMTGGTSGATAGLSAKFSFKPESATSGPDRFLFVSDESVSGQKKVGEILYTTFNSLTPVYGQPLYHATGGVGQLPTPSGFDYTVVQYNSSRGGFLAATDDGRIFANEVGDQNNWQELSLTIDGVAASDLGGNIVELSGRTVTVAKVLVGGTYIYYASVTGENWIKFTSPLNSKNVAGKISNDGVRTFFLTEKEINAPTGQLPSYYKITI